MDKSTPTFFTIPGKVYLMGAGPGSKDLLTVRAAEVLSRADVVLHDDLVSPEILDLLPARTAVYNVGKRCGTKNISQDEIHERMVDAARHGHTVIRLKGGDPLIFGRIQDEIRALREANIAFEIIPGVTAASAAAAVAEIALTERSVASKLVFVSNHRCAGKENAEWHAGVASDATLVFYMPGKRLDLLAAELTAAGLPGVTPCLLVSNVARATQELQRISLRHLTSAIDLPAPALFIVGALAADARAEEWISIESAAQTLQLDLEEAPSREASTSGLTSSPDDVLAL